MINKRKENKQVPLDKQSTSDDRLIGVWDMIDSEFINEELPEDFCYDMIAEMFKEDPMVKVMNQSLDYQGQKMSRVVVCDYDNGVVHLGPKYLSEPFFIPKEDFTSADMVLDYAEKFKKGIYVEYPDCPMPIPIIPENQYYRPNVDYALERMAVDAGMYLSDPSVGVSIEFKDYNICQVEKEMGLTPLKHVKSVEENVLLFLPYHDVIDEMKYEGCHYVAMQFNPFHPMATHFIESYQWEGSTITGTYKYRGIKSRKFNMNINDYRYRIHSHIWLQMMKGYKFEGAIEPFDMVGNFDFNRIFKFRDKEVHVEPLIIEPIVPVSPIVELRPYSYLGRGNLFARGAGERTYCLYANIIKKNIRMDKWAIDITSEIQMHVNRQSFLFEGVEYTFKKKELQADYIFFRWYDKGDFKAFQIFDIITKVGYDIESNGPVFEMTYHNAKYGHPVKLKYVPNGGDQMDVSDFFLRFMYTELKFYSFPRNNTGTIIYDFSMIQLQDALKMEPSELHEYMPYLVPYAGDEDRLSKIIYTQLDTFEIDMEDGADIQDDVIDMNKIMRDNDYCL